MKDKMTAVRKTKATPEFEKSLQRLEAIVEQLEGDALDLDKALALFEEGSRLSRECGQYLNEVEKRVLKLVEKRNGEVEYIDHTNDDSVDEEEKP